MVQLNRIIMTFRDTFITHYIKYIHLIQLPEKFHHLNTWQRIFLIYLLLHHVFVSKCSFYMSDISYMSHIKYELCLLCISPLLVLIILMVFFQAVINNTYVSTLAASKIAIFQLFAKVHIAILQLDHVVQLMDLMDVSKIYFRFNLCFSLWKAIQLS